MAVTATGSKYKQKTGYIIAVFCLGITLYCLYDGWISQDYQQKHIKDGQPDANLMANRIYLPLAAMIYGSYMLFSSIRLRTKKIVADSAQLTLSNGEPVDYSQITQIDKRFFEKEGHFTVFYKKNGQEMKIKLSGQNYDGLGLLLDELVRCTGAAPADPGKADSSEPS